MKKVLTLRKSWAVSWPMYSSILTTWLEQVSSWVLLLGVDWTRLPWVFAGATISMWKSRKDKAGQPIHKPFYEWALIVLSGTVIGMAGWKDVMNAASFLKLSADLSSVTAGLLGWLLADYIIAFGVKQLDKKTNDTP